MFALIVVNSDSIPGWNPKGSPKYHQELFLSAEQVYALSVIGYDPETKTASQSSSLSKINYKIKISESMLWYYIKHFAYVEG